MRDAGADGGLYCKKHIKISPWIESCALTPIMTYHLGRQADLLSHRMEWRRSRQKNSRLRHGLGDPLGEWCNPEGRRKKRGSRSLTEIHSQR